MDRRKCQNSVLAASSEELQHSTRRGISRRQFVQTSAGAIAAGSLLGKRAFAAPKPLKIGYVSPETGELANFGEADTFVIDQVRKNFQGGIPAGGATRQVEILVRDSQSSSNRAAEVAASLIKSEKIDLMLVASTADTVNPVSDQCEINQVPCVSTDALWQTWFFVRGGTPVKGFDWTYLFYFGVEGVSQIMCDLFEGVPTNHIVGCLWANDPEGNFNSDPVRGFPHIFGLRGFKAIDSGRFQLNTNDFSPQISLFKEHNAEILHGILPLPVFTNFWNQAAQQGFKPKMAVIGKALEYPSGIESMGKRGRGLAIEMTFGPNFPFKSSLVGMSARQLCDEYETVTKKQYTEPLGFRHALFEVAADVFKRTQNPESNMSVIEAVRTTRLDTIVGPVAWQGPPPNEWTTIPVKNVCTTPCVGSQWVPGQKWMYDKVVVDNRRYPLIPVQRKMEPLMS